MNYSLYLNFLNLIATVVNKHSQVKSITQGEFLDNDEYEFASYPFCNMFINNITVEGTTSIYDLNLTVGDKVVDINTESSGSTNSQVVPFYGTNDEVFVFDNTLGILNDVIAYMSKNINGVEVNSNTTFTPFRERNKNNLAGFVANFQVTVHNSLNGCLLGEYID